MAGCDTRFFAAIAATNECILILSFHVTSPKLGGGFKIRGAKLECTCHKQTVARYEEARSVCGSAYLTEVKTFGDPERLILT